MYPGPRGVPVCYHHIGSSKTSNFKHQIQLHTRVSPEPADMPSAVEDPDTACGKVLHTVAAIKNIQTHTNRSCKICIYHKFGEPLL